MIKITLNIEGMACHHCEAHMNDAVKNAFGITKVASSHEKKQTVFTVETDIDDSKLESVVADAGYQLTGINRETVKSGLFGLFKK